MKVELKDYLKKLGIEIFPTKTNDKLEEFKELLNIYGAIDEYSFVPKIFDFSCNNIPEHIRPTSELDLYGDSCLKYLFFIKMYLVCELFNENPLDTIYTDNDYVKYHLSHGVKNNDDFQLEEEFEIYNFLLEFKSGYHFKYEQYECIKKYNELFNKMYLTSIFYNIAKKTTCNHCGSEIFNYQISGYRSDYCDGCF